MGNVKHLFDHRARSPREWTRYERELRDAMAYVERGDHKSALASIGYASTLPNSERPDEITRRALFREFCNAAQIWESET